MIKMDNFCDNLAKLLQNPENYLRPNETLYKSWIDQTTLSYNGLKANEGFFGLPASGEALPELYTDGLDMEQIWQQVELQNNTLLAAPEDLTSLDDINLPYCVVKLNSRLKYDSMNNNVKDGEAQEKKGEGDSESEMEEDEEVDDNAEDKNIEDEEDGDDMNEDEEDDLDMDLDGKEKKPLGSLLDDDEFGDMDSDDFDEDHYDDLAPEGQEDDDDDDEDDDIEDDDDHYKDDKKQRSNEEDDDDEEGDEINGMKKSLEKDKNKMDILKKPDNFKSTTVDDSFFNLRESEWVADNDILGAELDGNLDDIDFFEDVTDEEEDAGAAMYNTFFDSIDKNKKRTKKNNEETNNGKEKDNINSEKNTNSDENEDEDKNEDSKEESDDEEDMEGVTKLLGGNKKQTKSTFEREQEKERQIIESLEDEQMTEKPWFLKGEVQSRDRPENSTLEEHLDYDIAAKQRPVITEDTTALVEKLILNRIRTQAFDDVERKIKPEVNPFEYKKKLLLDQEKSKKSLAEIYEEEYIKKQNEEAEDDEEPKAHTEIKSMMDSLFNKLDALANYHYTPKHRKAEVKIVSNLPAVTMEEASPATATDASLLAPQEVLAPVRGELRSAGERTTTDKKRERRQKKSKQKAKAKEEEKKLSEKLKKVGQSDGGKLDKKSSAKVIQKAVKAGQVKMLSDNQSNKHIKSSQSFFKQLQDDVSSQISKKKDQSIEKKKKKKEMGQTTASKIML